MKWEYLTVEVFDTRLNAELEHAGSKGWELVSATLIQGRDANTGEHADWWKLIFKQPYGE